MNTILEDEEETRFWTAVERLLEERKLAMAPGPRTWREVAIAMGINESLLSNRRYQERRQSQRRRPLPLDGEGMTVASVAAALDVAGYPMAAGDLLERAGIKWTSPT